MVGIDKAQTPPRQGHVAAQAFEPPPVRAGDPRCRMQPKAARSKAQGRRTHPGGRIFQDPAQALAGACPVAVSPRTDGESSQHGLFVGERIRCGVVEQAAFRAQADDAARTRLHDLLHGLVRQRRGGNENRSVLPIDVDPVEHEHMQSNLFLARSARKKASRCMRSRKNGLSVRLESTRATQKPAKPWELR